MFNSKYNESNKPRLLETEQRREGDRMIATQMAESIHFVELKLNYMMELLTKVCANQQIPIRSYKEYVDQVKNNHSK